jgi:hypothetical protein
MMINCANQGKARSDMTVEERIAAADRRKTEGNEYNNNNNNQAF